jgi:hypothetical protein
MTEQKTIIPESTAEKIIKGIKRQSKSRKMLAAISIIFLVLIAGYMTGYNSGYHQALLDFNIIAGRMITL